MRPLALLVVAEFLVLLLLIVLWLGGTPAAANGVTRAPAAPVPTSDVTPVAAEVTPAAAASPPIERREAEPPVPAVAADDPLGILVSGTVLGTDGTPVEGASVSFRSDAGYRSGDAAGPGVYAVAGLQPGEWTLTCRAEGFADHENPCTLDTRAFQQVDIELKPSYVVRVKVQSADGTSIMAELERQLTFGAPYVVATEVPLTGDLPITDNARVLSFGVGEWRGAWDAGQDQKQLRELGFAGEISLNQPPPLHAALLLRHVLLQTQRIEPGQHDLVFTMETKDLLARFGTVALRLLDGVTGEPIRDAGLRLETAQGGGAHGATGADGRAVIEHALPGLSCLVLLGSPEREELFRYVRVPAGGAADLGDITLSARVKVKGQVVGNDGKPANGAKVQWTELDCRTFPQPLAYRRTASADAEGRFELWGCGRHRYVVSARQRDGGFGFATVDASGGAPPPLTIVLATPTTVAVHSQFDATAGYVLTVLAEDRSPVAVAWLAGRYRPRALGLPAGAYTVEIHDMKTDQLVRSFPLQVGSEPLSIEVP